MKKILNLMLMVLFCIMTYGTISVLAEEVEIGDYKYNISVEDKEANILKYLGDDEEVTIPSKVAYNGEECDITYICGYAFEQCANLKVVKIPDGDIKLFCNAFYGCLALEVVYIGKDVSGLVYAINRCYNLHTAIFEEGATKISNRFFLECPSLKKVVIPGSLTSVGEWIFKDSGDVSADIVFYYTGTVEQWSLLQGNIGEGNPLLVGATPHKVSLVNTESTCEEDGVRNKYVCAEDGECLICGSNKVIYEETVEKIGHDWDETKSEENLTRPVSDGNGSWINGYYTYTCKNDANHTMTEAVARADYDGYQEAYAQLGALFNGSNITDDAKVDIRQKIKEILNENFESGYVKNNYIETEQYILDDTEEDLCELREYLEAGIEDGTMIKAENSDYAEIDALISDIESSMQGIDQLSEKAQSELATIKTAIADFKSSSNISKAEVRDVLEDSINDAKALKKATDNVKAMLTAIEEIPDELTEADLEDVQKLKGMYEALSDYEKSLFLASVNTEVKGILVKAENLVKPDEDEDSEKGDGTGDNTGAGNVENNNTGAGNNTGIGSGDGGANSGDATDSGDTANPYWMVAILLSGVGVLTVGLKGKRPHLN